LIRIHVSDYAFPTGLAPPAVEDLKLTPLRPSTGLPNTPTELKSVSWAGKVAIELLQSEITNGRKSVATPEKRREFIPPRSKQLTLHGAALGEKAAAS
jgi:hypothetical protein